MKQTEVSDKRERAAAVNNFEVQVLRRTLYTTCDKLEASAFILAQKLRSADLGEYMDEGVGPPPGKRRNK